MCTAIIDNILRFQPVLQKVAENAENVQWEVKLIPEDELVSL